MNEHINPKDGDPVENAVQVEAEIEDRADLSTLAVAGGPGFAEQVRAQLGLDADMLFYERDQDEPVTTLPARRKAVRIIGHRCRQVVVEIRYEHDTKHEKFPPSATVGKVLKWAVSKRGFNLDPMQAAKANLMLPDADAPLPREDAIGKHVKHGQCTLVVDLTLRDFTNG